MSDDLATRAAQGMPTLPTAPDLPPRPTQRAPKHPAPVAKQRKPLATDRVEWSARVFQLRGWNSRRAEQEVLKGELDAAAGAMFPAAGPGSAAGLAAEKLSPGKEFKAYLGALSAFEADKTDPRNMDRLKTAAAGYIAHYQKHSKSIQAQKETKRKYEACSKTLAGLDRLAQIENLGEPPWNSEKAMQAASLKAEADFDSLPIDDRAMRALDPSAGANASFWIDKAGTVPGQSGHTYLFKPAANDSKRDAVPVGGEPAREALTGRAGDILKAMAGIDCHVPQTDIIQVRRERLPEGPLSDSVADRTGSAPLTGSLQQFASTDGELRDNSAAAGRAVTAQRCQELAVLDIVTLHVDRHGGNFLLDGKAGRGGAADLIPIDNGLSFPHDVTALGRMSTRHNALLGLPGAHEPFTPEMLKKIATIEPDALKATLRKEVATLEKVHPGTKGMVKDEALEMSRRSALFLKLAAPSLSPALIQVALGQYRTELFAVPFDERAFRQAAARIIQQMQTDAPLLQDYFQMSAQELATVTDAVADNGWAPVSLLSPQQVMKLFSTGLGRPARPARNAAGGANPTDKELADIQAAFPKVNLRTDASKAEAVAYWRELQAKGGMAKAMADAAKFSGEDDSNYISVTRFVDNAVEALDSSADAERALTGAVVSDARLLDTKLAHIGQLAALLSDQLAAAAYVRQAAELRRKSDKPGLDKLRDAVSTVAGAELRTKIDAYVAQVTPIATSPRFSGDLAVTLNLKGVRDAQGSARGSNPLASHERFENAKRTLDAVLMP